VDWGPVDSEEARQPAEDWGPVDSDPSSGNPGSEEPASELSAKADSDPDAEAPAEAEPEAGPLMEFKGHKRPPTQRPALYLLVPAACTGGNPVIVLMAAPLFAKSLGIPTWLAGAAAVGVFCIPTLGAVIYLVHRNQLYRRVRLDAKGFVFGYTEKWRGSRLRFKRIAGFKIIRAGVMLVLKRRPWTRWLGPLVPCEDREIHELVVHLEEAGVYRFEG